MRQYYDDFDDFGYANYPAINRMRREQRREEGRFARRRKPYRRSADYIDADDLEGIVDYDETTGMS